MFLTIWRMVDFPEPRLPKKMYVVSLGVKPCRSAPQITNPPQQPCPPNTCTAGNCERDINHNHTIVALCGKGRRISDGTIPPLSHLSSCAQQSGRLASGPSQWHAMECMGGQRVLHVQRLGWQLRLFSCTIGERICGQAVRCEEIRFGHVVRWVSASGITRAFQTSGEAACNVQPH